GWRRNRVKAKEGRRARNMLAHHIRARNRIAGKVHGERTETIRPAETKAWQRTRCRRELSDERDVRRILDVRRADVIADEGLAGPLDRQTPAVPAEYSLVQVKVRVAGNGGRRRPFDEPFIGRNGDRRRGAVIVQRQVSPDTLA